MQIKETEDTFIIKGKARCSSCEGTGLYRGFGESKSCAVVCVYCKGTGVITIDLAYEKFTGLVKRDDVKHVFGKSCGYGHTNEDVLLEDGRTIEFSKAGCTYEEWWKGHDPKPVKDLYCPYLWVSQDLRKCEALRERCDKIRFGSMISNCPNYPGLKSGCWAIFEKEKTED